MNKERWVKMKKWSAKQLMAGVMSTVMLAGMIPVPVQATQAELMEEVAQLCASAGLRKKIKVVQGGATRTESVLAAAMEANNRYLPRLRL